MKTLLPKILSTALVLLLAFTLFGAFMPASQVEAGKVRWSEVNSPGSAGSAANYVIADCDIIDIEIANDGTMFAAVLAEGAVPGVGAAYLVAGQYGILKSSTGGNTWRSTGFTPVAAAADQIVDIAASQSYSENTTLWVALANSIQRTINGGTTFGNITPAILGGAETITSIDVAPDYLGAGINAVVGTAVAAGGGRVLLYTERSGGWGVVDADGDPITAGFQSSWDAAVPVITNAWVAFSPDYENDGEIVAVSTNGATTVVRASFQERAWDSEVLASIPLQQENTGLNIIATDASIAFPDDYDALSAINLFVGIDSGNGPDGIPGNADDPAVQGDAFRIIGQRVGSPTGSIRIDLNVHPNRMLDVHSITVAGSMSGDLTVLVGAADSNDVRISTNATTTVPSWAGATKRPTGANNVEVKVANDYATSGTVYASTMGAESALSRAIDGKIFNGISLIDTAIGGTLDLAVASSNIMFLVTSPDAIAAGPESLWRTTNGGSNWERVLSTLQTNGMTNVAVSPEYNEDSTVYTAHAGATQMWKSGNGGDTFNGVSAREPIAAPLAGRPATNPIAVVDSSTLYVASQTTEIWKSANSGLRWTRSQEKPAGIAQNIAVSPNFEADDSILVATQNGRVYLSQDGGLNFRRQGSVNPGGAAVEVYAAFDNAYADSGILFAAPANVGGADVEGIYRWKVGDSTAWDQINNNLFSVAPAVAALEARGLVVSNGVLYASDAIGGIGMARSVSPKAPLQFAPGAFAMVGGGLPGNATLGDIEVIEGTIISIDTANNRLYGFSDTLSTATTVTAPKPGTVVREDTVTLTWAALPDATQYQTQIRLDSAYTVATGLDNAGTTATSDVLRNLVPGTTYYWRVRSNQPVLSPWATGNFTVALTAPVLTSPDPGQAAIYQVPIRPQFSWRSVVGAASYELQLSDNPFFADAQIKKPLSNTVWVWDEDLEYNTTYYWRVRAIGANTQSAWTEGAFTTIAEGAAAGPTTQPPSTITVSVPTVTLTPPASVEVPAPIAPGYLWAIIIIGAVLIIALIVLIVRTRRVV